MYECGDRSAETPLKVTAEEAYSSNGKISTSRVLKLSAADPMKVNLNCKIKNRRGALNAPRGGSQFFMQLHDHLISLHA